MMGMMTVVYIVGPFRADNAWRIEQNVRRAEERALECWRAGFAVVCPHTNTRFFQGAADDSVWLDGDIEIMLRCDAICTVGGWERSSGSRKEIGIAEEYDLPVFHSVAELRQWHTKQRRVEAGKKARRLTPPTAGQA